MEGTTSSQSRAGLSGQYHKPTQSIQSALDVIYRAAGVEAKRSDTNCADQVLFEIINHFSALTMREDSSQYDRVVELHCTPVPLQEAIVVLIMSRKNGDVISFTEKDISDAVNVICHHDKASGALIRAMRFYQSYENFSLKEGVAQYNVNAALHNKPCIQQHDNPLTVLPSEIFGLMHHYVKWQDIKNCYTTSKTLSVRFPFHIREYINYWKQEKHDGPVRKEKLCPFFYNWQIRQFAQRAFLDCGPNTLVKMQTGRPLLSVAMKGSFEISEEEGKALKKYIGDGLFEESYYQQLALDQQHELLRILIIPDIQKHIDSIARDNNQVINWSPAKVPNMLVFLKALESPLIKRWIASGKISVSQLCNVTQGCLDALGNNDVTSFVERGFLKKREFISLTSLAVEVLGNRGVQNDLLFKDDDQRSPRLPLFEFVLSANPLVLESLLSPVVRAHIYIDCNFSNNKIFSRSELARLNKNGHDTVRNDELMNRFCRFIRGVEPKYESGRKALFEYWYVLKEKEITASDIYNYSTEHSCLLLERGRFDEYCTLIAESKKMREK